MCACTVVIPNEKNDKRVALVPAGVSSLLKKGASVIIEKGAGVSAGFSDEEYKKQGATIATAPLSKADVVLSITPLSQDTVAKAAENSCWVSVIAPQETALLMQMAKKKMTCYSLLMLPRISRAQSMDALTSQSNLAGYKAVLVAAASLPKVFPLLMTAAGTIKPAKVVVLGAGVAGLSAIATAKRLGALTYASDVRPAAKEQVESLGGIFIDVPFDNNAEDSKGYAKEVSKQYLKRQAKEVAKHVAQADAVITTALIPGKPAPLLISEEGIKAMKLGSVIVDLATAQGGNCACSEKDKTVVKHGVTIVGNSAMASEIAYDASQVYSHNISTFVSGIISEKGIAKNDSDEIYTETLLLDQGQPVHPLVKEGWK